MPPESVQARLNVQRLSNATKIVGGERIARSPGVLRRRLQDQGQLWYLVERRGHAGEAMVGVVGPDLKY